MFDILVAAVVIAFIAVGLSYVIVDSVIAEEPRNWLLDKIDRIKNDYFRNKAADLLGCRYCTSFHVCWVSGLIAWNGWAILPAFGLSVLLLDWSIDDH